MCRGAARPQWRAPDVARAPPGDLESARLPRTVPHARLIHSRIMANSVPAVMADRPGARTSIETMRSHSVFLAESWRRPAAVIEIEPGPSIARRSHASSARMRPRCSRRMRPGYSVPMFRRSAPPETCSSRAAIGIPVQRAERRYGLQHHQVEGALQHVGLVRALYLACQCNVEWRSSRMSNESGWEDGSCAAQKYRSVSLDIPVFGVRGFDHWDGLVQSVERVELLQGTLDLIVLRALATMGPQHAYGLAARLEQVAEAIRSRSTRELCIRRSSGSNRRAGYRGTWQRTESNGREAKYYGITKSGRAGAGRCRWRAGVGLAGLVEQAAPERVLEVAAWRRFFLRLRERVPNAGCGARFEPGNRVPPGAPRRRVPAPRPRRGRARRAAVRALGGVECTKGSSPRRTVVRVVGRRMAEISSDSVRTLKRSPGFAVVVIGMMALAIGATTTLFSLAYGVLAKPLPWSEAERLVRVEERRGGSRGRIPWTITNATYLAWRADHSTVEEIGGWLRGQPMTMTGVGDAERLLIGAVTPSLFRLLRTGPAIGRLFVDQDAIPGSDGAIILGFGLWQRRLRWRCRHRRPRHSRSTGDSSPSSVSCPGVSSFQMPRFRRGPH